jgi:predicted SAM-dependent methyltransferase
MSDSFESYRFANSPVKLHFGGGKHVLPSWFNTDLNPRFETVERLDVTLPFDIPTASVDFIFTEHLIEHIPYADGRHVISNAFEYCALVVSSE